jgi:hypothetical protein
MSARGRFEALMAERTNAEGRPLSWFVIEIGVALAPLALLLWWTVRTLRRHGQAPPADGGADDGGAS